MEWGSAEFIARTLPVTEVYIRPIDNKDNLSKLSDCDMTIMQPLMDFGLWVRASDDEVRQWKNG